MPHPPTLHAHLPVGDLLDLANRTERAPSRPEWLGKFVDAAAELFDPLNGLGRVGYRSEPGEDGWSVALFLGATEIIGGPGDGLIAPARFRFDAAALAALFDAPPTVGLEVAPQISNDGVDGLDAALTLVGTIDGHSLTATVLSVPPDGVEPGFKRYASGLAPMSAE